MRILIIFLAFLSFIDLNAQDPSVLWSFELNDIAFGCSSAADIDGDGKLEIVFSTYRNDGHIYALNAEDGSLHWKYDIGGCSDAAPLICDVDGDKLLDVILHSSCQPYMYCFNGLDGSVKWKVQSRGTDSPPSASDINGDGLPEIFDGDFRGYVSCFNGTDGSVIWETLIEKGYFLQTAPVLTDINNDDNLEIIVGTYNLDSLCSVYALKSRDGSVLWKSEDQFYSIYHGPVALDIDDNGIIDLVFSDFNGYLYCLNAANGTTKWSYNLQNCKNSLSPTTVADLNNDGKYEIIYFCDNMVNVINGEGELLWDFEMINGISAFRGGIAVDVNEDSYLDVVFGNFMGELTAVSGLDGSLIWNMDISEIAQKNLNISSGVIASDFNEDGKIELFIIGGWTYTDIIQNYGKAYMVSLDASGDSEWLMFRNNEKRNAFISKNNPNVIINDNRISTISPNPSSDFIEISLERCRLSAGCTPSDIKIYNIYGKCLYNYESRITKYEDVRIDISHLHIGLYFIQIGDYTDKFLVVR
jgi:outer membrane protein assembly factor BamB